jgi:hypothetical protein
MYSKITLFLASFFEFIFCFEYITSFLVRVI